MPRNFGPGRYGVSLYRVIYEVTNELIRIIAIAHTSRDPEHWVDRVR